MIGLLLLVALLSARVHAEVIELTQDDFFKSVMSGSEDWLVYMTSDADPNADAKDDMLEALSATADKYKIVLAEANCGVREHKKMCTALLGAASTPTGQPAMSSLRLISGPSSPNPYTKKPMRGILPFEG